MPPSTTPGAVEFARAVPPGPPVSPESLYAELALEALAPDERPYVVCNFVSSVDGKAEVQGTSGALGGDGDLATFRALRTQCDGILAGTGTLRAERYGALVRDAPRQRLRVAQGRAPQPLGVVVSRSGDVPYDIPLFADSGSRLALYLGAGARVPETAAHLTVHTLTGEGGLREAMHSLRQDHGVRSVLCEGGPGLFNALLAEDLVDELFLTLAPALVGGSGIGITAGPPPGAPPQSMDLVWALERDSHLFLRYARERGHGPRLSQSTA
ncbi:MAG: dihydrofolate reductase family protein [Solirubrobacteraceae bacterium]